MAIYHFHCAMVKRSSGHSATAGAAYQSHERIYDERTGEAHDYTRRKGKVETGIVTPTNAPDWARSRAQLWNAVEHSENRKDAQLARGFDMALPRELNALQRLELVRGFAQAEFGDKGMVADYANHPPHKRRVKGQEESNDNWHVHYKVTLREIGPSGFGKKNRDWNSREQMEHWREAWAFHCNKALEKAGRYERIDHRSFESQRAAHLQFAQELKAMGLAADAVDFIAKAAKLDRRATIHLGKAATLLERRGIQTERGDYNRAIMSGIAEKNAIQESIRFAGNHLDELSKEAKAVTELIIYLQAEREMRQQNTVMAPPSRKPIISNNLETIKSKTSIVKPSNERVKLIDALNDVVSKLHNKQETECLSCKESELMKLINNLIKYFPDLNIEISRKESIGERIKQPDIMHLIRLIEGIEAKKRLKRYEEMTILRH